MNGNASAAAIASHGVNVDQHDVKRPGGDFGPRRDGAPEAGCFGAGEPNAELPEESRRSPGTGKAGLRGASFAFGRLCAIRNSQARDRGLARKAVLQKTRKNCLFSHVGQLGGLAFADPGGRCSQNCVTFIWATGFGLRNIDPTWLDYLRYPNALGFPNGKPCYRIRIVIVCVGCRWPAKVRRPSVILVASNR